MNISGSVGGVECWLLLVARLVVVGTYRSSDPDLRELSVTRRINRYRMSAVRNLAGHGTRARGTIRVGLVQHGAGYTVLRYLTFREMVRFLQCHTIYNITNTRYMPAATLYLAHLYTHSDFTNGSYIYRLLKLKPMNSTD